MNYQLESRMRENRQSGSEGGGAKPIASPYPYHISRLWRLEPEFSHSFRSDRMLALNLEAMTSSGDRDY